MEQLYTAINDPTELSAFAQELATDNIENINIRAKPNAGELLEQKLQSLRSFTSYWYEVLCTGYIDHSNSFGPNRD